MARLAAFAPLALVLTASTAHADVFTYTDEKGQEQTVTARLAGNAQQWLALELEDGQWDLVPAGAVKKRVPGADPKPITVDEMTSRLEARFTKELFRVRTEGNNIVCLVLQAPIDAAQEGRLKPFLDKAIAFTQQIDRVFAKFCESMKLEMQPPRFPQVMVIFERDEDFDAYAKSVIQGDGPSVKNVAGFYSALSNWLAIRMDECDSFAIPLHEAIHQQCFNRGLLQRLAPIPTWFGEGIATGFENSGSTVSTDPTKINRNFATRSLDNVGLSFGEVIAKDESFGGDVTAGDAYTRAWALHWLLVTDRPKQYADYFRRLSRLAPLETKPQAERLQEFQQTFDLNPAQLEQTYQQKLAVELRKQRMKLTPQTRAGNIVTQDQTGLVELGLVRRGDLGGRLSAGGKIRNLNPMRTLVFRVSLIPPDGTGPAIAWLVPELGSGKTIPLDRQLAPVAGDRFRVEIRSAIPGSETAKAWPSQPGIVVNKGK